MIKSPALLVHLVQHIRDQMLAFPLGAAVFQYELDLLIRQIKNILGIAPVAYMVRRLRFPVLIRGKRLPYQLVQRDGIDLAEPGQKIQIRISLSGLVIGVCLTGDADSVGQRLLGKVVRFPISS